MTVEPRRRPIRRVAFIYPQFGPVTRKLWSGTPAGLVDGLGELGVEVVPFGYSLPPLVRKGLAAIDRLSGLRDERADHSRLRMRGREFAYAQRLNRIRDIDAGIAVGTDAFRLDRVPWAFPVASYDDTTLQTMWRHPDSDPRVQGFAERDMRAWIETQRRSMQAADAVCVSTSWAARSVIDDYGVPTAKVAVVGMGHRARPERRPESRDWSRPTFLFLGVEWRRKNGERVLEAFRQLRELVPDVRLHLVGEHPPVDLPGVTGHGFLPRSSPSAQAELDGIFRSATALVLPSLFDPSPISYLEAASAGIPVIATTEGGASSLLGDAAIAVHPYNVAAIREAMLLLCSPDEAWRRGQASIAAASAAGWRHVAERILASLAPAEPGSGARSRSAVPERDLPRTGT